MSANALDREVYALMTALEDGYAGVEVTPGGVSWLRVHHVPIRRLVMRLVRRLQTMREPVSPVHREQPLVAARESASIGYVSYDVTDAGVAYTLGLRDDDPKDDVHGTEPEVARQPSRMFRTQLCAISWSSRHAETLLPVLVELAERGITTTVVDASTESSQRFPEPHTPGILVVRLPEAIFAHNGAPPFRHLGALLDGPTVPVGQHEMSLGRLAQLVSYVLVRSTDCTQPSWAAAFMAECWLHGALTALRPDVLLCSNDTSPLGVLAVAAADRIGASTVYVQHETGWMDRSVGRRRPPHRRYGLS
ncbi:hypothetical protein [Streptomyces cupreus]|uniref:Uncharacterized protein n=1 Tax=Streptomyces cupreus TaxID=2759956 RepID=A0A7X1JA06_9ACTN|nr:hypothetical protein [Streptomyces cupreus]MBC2906885.1 hypothetical protein [Streptomyces cupreus]